MLVPSMPSAPFSLKQRRSSRRVLGDACSMLRPLCGCCHANFTAAEITEGTQPSSGLHHMHRHSHWWELFGRRTPLNLLGDWSIWCVICTWQCFLSSIQLTNTKLHAIVAADVQQNYLFSNDDCHWSNALEAINSSLHKISKPWALCHRSMYQGPHNVPSLLQAGPPRSCLQLSHST